MYPSSSVGYGFSRVGWPSGKCNEQTLENRFGCQLVCVPSPFRFNSWVHRLLVSGSFLSVGNECSVKGCRQTQRPSLSPRVSHSPVPSSFSACSCCSHNHAQHKSSYLETIYNLSVFLATSSLQGRLACFITLKLILTLTIPYLTKPISTFRGRDTNNLNRQER